MTKVGIVEKLGERAVLLPALIEEGLAANDRLKIRLTMLQEAAAQVSEPGRAAPSNEDAETGAPGGSGFLVGESCAIPEAVFLFAVTNAHVARSCPVIRTAGPVERLVVRSESDWYRHPDQDDVVVTPIGFAPKDARAFYMDYVPREWFVTPENFSHATHDVSDLSPGIGAHAPLGYKCEHQPLGWPFGPGEEVVMLL